MEWGACTQVQGWWRLAPCVFFVGPDSSLVKETRQSDQQQQQHQQNVFRSRVPLPVCVCSKTQMGDGGCRCSRRWQLRSEAERGATSPRAADGRSGACRGPAPQLGRKADRDAQRPTRTDDGKRARPALPVAAALQVGPGRRAAAGWRGWEAVDHTALSYLLQQSLSEMEEEAERKKAKKEKESSGCR